MLWFVGDPDEHNIKTLLDNMDEILKSKELNFYINNKPVKQII